MQEVNYHPKARNQGILPPTRSSPELFRTAGQCYETNLEAILMTTHIRIMGTNPLHQFGEHRGP